MDNVAQKIYFGLDVSDKFVRTGVDWLSCFGGLYSVVVSKVI